MWVYIFLFIALELAYVEGRKEEDGRERGWERGVIEERTEK